MIRTATEEDIPRLVVMGRNFIGLTGYQRHIAANDIQMECLARQLISGSDTDLFVFERDGQILGMLGAMSYGHPISGEAIASEIFWWVDPEHRGVGVALFKKFEAWAREHGAAKIQMGAPAGTKVGKFYERLGFQEVETLYQRELK